MEILFCSVNGFCLQQERGGRRPDSSRKSSSARPSKTLFVINFDPINTRTRDIEKYFEHYGKISNVRIRRNFAFVQYELQEDATRALEETHLRSVTSSLMPLTLLFHDWSFLNKAISATICFYFFAFKHHIAFDAETSLLDTLLDLQQVYGSCDISGICNSG